MWLIIFSEIIQEISCTCIKYPYVRSNFRKIIFSIQFYRVQSSVFEQAAHEMVEVFKNERVGTYYVPPKKKDKFNPSRPASGKLYAKYYNSKRYASRKVDSEEGETGEPAAKGTSTNPEIAIAYQYLRVNRELSPKSMLCWRATKSVRKDFLQKNGLQKYLTEMPALATYQGYKLILDDFDTAYPMATNKLHEKWDDLTRRIVRLLVQRKIIGRDWNPDDIGENIFL